MKFTSLLTPLGLLTLLAMPVGQLLHAQARKPARYTVTDIGTLGGANSFSYSMTDSGTVVGGANTPGQNDPVAQTGFVWYGGRPINLGTLGGSACPDCSSEGRFYINGAVALFGTAMPDPNGRFRIQCPSSLRTNHQCLAAVWRNGRLTALPRWAETMRRRSVNNGEAAGFENGVPDATALYAFRFAARL
jgi:hypothetical protein